MVKEKEEGRSGKWKYDETITGRMPRRAEALRRQSSGASVTALGRRLPVLRRRGALRLRARGRGELVQVSCTLSQGARERQFKISDLRGDLCVLVTLVVKAAAWFADIVKTISFRQGGTGQHPSSPQKKSV